MGLFDVFKKPIILFDDFFGRLRYMQFKDPTKGYFEGNGFFAPVNAEIEYTVDADKTGPSEAQREFYSKLQEDYSGLVAKLKPMIEGQFRNRDEAFEIRDFGKEFTLTGISIPKITTQAASWEMTFETVHDEDHQIIIEFSEWQPLNVLIDG